MVAKQRVLSIFEFLDPFRDVSDEGVVLKRTKMVYISSRKGPTGREDRFRLLLGGTGSENAISGSGQYREGRQYYGVHSLSN